VVNPADPNVAESTRRHIRAEMAKLKTKLSTKLSGARMVGGSADDIHADDIHAGSEISALTSALPCCTDYCKENECHCGTWGCHEALSPLPSAWPLAGCCAIVAGRTWPAPCTNPNKCGGCSWNNGPCASSARTVAELASTETTEESALADMRLAAASWRDFHFVEYYSLGSVTRTGHLVDDPKSNTYRAIRSVKGKLGNMLYSEFTAVKDWEFQNVSFYEMFDLDKDKYQLDNIYDQQTAAMKQQLHELVDKEWKCKTASCQ